MIDLVTLALAKHMSGGGVSDYSNLTNKPKLNGVELNGDKSSLDLGIKTKSKIAIVDSFESSEHITPTVYRSTDDWYDYEGGEITLEEAYALADDAPIMFYGGYIGDYYGNQDHKLCYAGTIFEAQSDRVRNYKKIYRCEGYISEYYGKTPKKSTLEFVLNKRITREYDGAEPEITYELTYSVEDEIFNINIAYDYETDSIKSDKSYTEINSAIKKGIPIYVKAVLHANYTYYGIINNTYKHGADEYIRFIGINGETGTEDDNVGIGIIFITIRNDDTVVVHENANVTGSLYDLATVNKQTLVSAINEVNGLAKPAVVSQTAPTAITLANNTEYYLTGVAELTVGYPSGNFECWISLSTAASGTVTVTLPTSQYIGSAPSFGNGETWEISVKNGVVAAAKVGDGT